MEELFAGIVAGSLIGTILAIGITFLIVITSAVYAYFALAWMTIAKKVKYKYPWLAWIPFGKTIMILQMGNYHWAWVFLYLIPIIGWLALFAIGIIAKWRIFEKRKFPGWYSLLTLFMTIPKIGLIFYGVVLGIVAWKK